jgi:hypothetical protein
MHHKEYFIFLGWSTTKKNWSQCEAWNKNKCQLYNFSTTGIYFYEHNDVVR